MIQPHIYSGKHEGGYTWHVEAYEGKYAFVLDSGCQHNEKNYGEGFDTPELAKEAALVYCEAYGWKFHMKKGIWNIFVRNWAGKEWGFRVECGGMHSEAGFTHKVEALNRAFDVILEKEKEFEEKKRQNGN